MNIKTDMDRDTDMDMDMDMKLKKKKNVQRAPTLESNSTPAVWHLSLCNILYVLRLGMVRSRNGRSRYCPFLELSVLGMVALGIVTSRNGRVRNCHV
jgi:hypothetical protein